MANVGTRVPMRQPRGNRSFIVLLAVAFAAGLSILALVVMKNEPAVVAIAADAPPLPTGGYVMGSDSAPVEIVELGDFECPGCGQFALLTEPDVRTRLVATGRARFRFVDKPLPEIHPATLVAHNAAACAGVQHKFWDMHDSLFAGQFQWSEYANGRPMHPEAVVKRYAKAIGLDTRAFDACVDARTFVPQILASGEEARRRVGSTTPTFIIGTRMVPGALPYDMIKALVDSATRGAR